MQHYYYIFTGSGLAALMTVYEMLQDEFYQDKRILLLDADAKKTNDRTWCFWDHQNEFEKLTHRVWPKALFADEHFSRTFDLAPYQYKMLRGADFYRFVFDKIQQHPNIDFVQETVVDFEQMGQHCAVKTQNRSYTCNYIFNSIFRPEKVAAQQKYPLVQQHFVGWLVKTEQPVFTPDCVTFMDFSVAQKGNTRFMYVLPMSENEALVEYTLFSADLLEKQAYETEIKAYLEKLGAAEFEILETEQGNIPMTCYPFWKHNQERILHIGSAGGWTKASTGYTFKNTLKKSKQLAHFLKSKTDLRSFHKKNRFWFYDLLLIDILYHKNQIGSHIFASMFRRGQVEPIFKFLDEESSLAEDLNIILRCPKRWFILALVHRIFK
jgi:lycopene beta-cyclase